ncbi:MAG: hypothetical protein GY814_19625 [Gammaproteobacteria bacterium]|nr:hypothetical protein [Gammaproteobacteria bacterium]
MGHSCGLNFPLPEQGNKSKGERRLELQHFKEVLADLPYGDQEKAAHELFVILNKSNRIVLKADERLALIKQVEVQPPISLMACSGKSKTFQFP